MNKLTKFYLFLLLLLIVLISFLESSKPKIINWEPNYNTNKKSPFGLYIFDQELKNILKKNKLERLSVTPYEFFDAHYDYDTLVENYDIYGTFLSVKNQSDFDEESVNEILAFVSRGNTAFLSMNTLPQTILDSVKAEIYNDYAQFDTISVFLKDFKKKKYKLPKVNQISYFEKIDTLNTSALGFHQFNNSVKTNFIKVPYYDGVFYLHLQPSVFTNFQLLKNKNYQYTEDVLSYIPNDETVYWYTYSFEERMNNQESFMKVILTNDALRWAWYFILIGMLIYMFFNAKRKQRVVPIINPLPNTTVDFTKTIANLYYQEKDYKDILNKKIVFFLEKIRQEYYVETQQLNEDFIKKLHIKSGKDKELIEKIIVNINKYKIQYIISEKNLLEFNKLMEDFWS